MWERIKSAVQWLGNKTMAVFRWIGIKSGLISLAASPNSANNVAIENIKPPEETKEQENENLSTSAKNLLSDDALLQVSSFLNQTDFARTNQVFGYRRLDVQGVNSQKKPSHEEKEDKGYAVSPRGQARSSTRELKGLLHNQRDFKKISAAGNLLKKTEYADYEEVKNLIMENPALMFEAVSFKFRDGSEERISPLRYAFKVYDTYMWKKVFLKRIEEEKDSFKQEEYRKMFFEQMQAQAAEKPAHINLEELFQAYEEYDSQYQLWIDGDMSEDRVIEEWYKVGKKQKELLPVHMLKEFSREGDTWLASESFDVDKTPWPSNSRVYDYFLSSWISLSSILSDSEWGVSFSLMRCGIYSGLEGQGNGTCLLQGMTRRDASIDLRVLRRLFEVRSNAFASQLFVFNSRNSNQDLGSHNSVHAKNSNRSP